MISREWGYWEGAEPPQCCGIPSQGTGGGCPTAVLAVPASTAGLQWVFPLPVDFPTSSGFSHLFLHAAVISADVLLLTRSIFMRKTSSANGRLMFLPLEGRV